MLHCRVYRQLLSLQRIGLSLFLSMQHHKKSFVIALVKPSNGLSRPEAPRASGLLGIIRAPSNEKRAGRGAFFEARLAQAFDLMKKTWEKQRISCQKYRAQCPAEASISGAYEFRSIVHRVFFECQAAGRRVFLAADHGETPVFCRAGEEDAVAVPFSGGFGLSPVPRQHRVQQGGSARHDYLGKKYPVRNQGYIKDL
jgi:hypothetical protein